MMKRRRRPRLLFYVFLQNLFEKKLGKKLYLGKMKNKIARPCLVGNFAFCVTGRRGAVPYAHLSYGFYLCGKLLFTYYE